MFVEEIVCVCVCVFVVRMFGDTYAFQDDRMAIQAYVTTLLRSLPSDVLVILISSSSPGNFCDVLVIVVSSKKKVCDSYDGDFAANTLHSPFSRIFFEGFSLALFSC